VPGDAGANVISIDRKPRPTIVAPVALQPVLDRLMTWDQQVLVDTVERFPADGYETAAALCADAGADAATAASALRAVGADPVRLRRAMKQPVVDAAGERHFLFDDVDAAFRVGSPPRWLEPEAVRLFELVDVDDATRVRGVVDALHTEGQRRRGEIVEVLTYLGVTDDDIVSIVDAALGPAAIVNLPPASRHHSGTARNDRRGPIGDDTDQLLRRVVDDGADAARVAALATGLGLSHHDTIAACARLGLDESFVAHVAVEHRHGDIDAAAADLEAGWDGVQPTRGWHHHLSPTAQSVPQSPTVRPDDLPLVPDGTINAILLQWQQAAAPAPAPAVP
jgi:hypothetical protein